MLSGSVGPEAAQSALTGPVSAILESGVPLQSAPSKSVNVGSLPPPDVQLSGTPVPHTEPGSISKPFSETGTDAGEGTKLVGLPHVTQVASFTGMTYALDKSLAGSHWVPSDTTLAVGPSHVMELVNVVGGIWTKQGANVEQFSQRSFYGVPSTDELGDPRVIYDPLSSRWFATVADFTTRGVYVGVSVSNDPTGNWIIPNPFFPSSGYCPDQPSVGVSNDKVVVTVNVYGPSCSNETTWAGFQYWVMNKAELTGGGSFNYCVHSVDKVAFMLYPAQPYSSTNTLYMVSVNDTAASRAMVWTLSGVPTSSGCNTYNYNYAPITATHYPPNAPQQGTSYLVDTGDSRIADAFWNQGKLWAAFNDRCTPAGDASARSCFRVLEIDTTSNTTVQDFDVGVSGEYLYYPALRMNSQGNLVVVFSYSSSNDYPSVGVTNQPKGTPSNNYLAPGVLLQGSGFEAPGSYACTSTACRFGDYSGASTDPSSASSIWVAAEYGTAAGWSTYIANLNPGSPQGIASLTASYSVVGGGTAYTAPGLTYTLAGQQYTTTLSTSPSQYYADVGSQWSATNPLLGSTASERWYSSSTNGTISAAATVAIAYNHQFLLTAVGLTTATEWDNAGTQISLNIAEVFGRSNGVGDRVKSMTLDNGPSQTFPLTSGTVPVSFVMNSAHTLVFTIVQQYQVTLDSNAARALSSITPPTISGDNYWYDSGSQVSVSLNGVWGRASGTGSRLTSYAVNGGSATATSTTATVAALSVSSISAPQSVTATIATQYQLSTPTGSVASATSPPISGDAGWYDSGAAVTVNYDNVWNVVAQQSRLAATGYAVDGGSVTSVPVSGSGTFQVRVTMNSAHSIDVKSVTQYYTSFKFTDASGSKSISPTNLQISISGKTLDVPGFSTWLDSGTTFTVSRLTYEGVDVKPTTPQQYSVAGPASISLKGSVYDATVKVTDLLGLAVSGAQVRMTLANGTLVSGTTNGDGIFVAPQIPLGTFSASVSNLGSTAQITGDASKQSVTAASVLFSTTSLALVVVAIAVVVGLAVFMLRRRSGRRLPPPPV